MKKPKLSEIQEEVEVLDDFALMSRKMAESDNEGMIVFGNLILKKIEELREEIKYYKGITDRVAGMLMAFGVSPFPDEKVSDDQYFDN